VTGPPAEEERPWGNPVGPLSLQWSTPHAEPPPVHGGSTLPPAQPADTHPPAQPADTYPPATLPPGPPPTGRRRRRLGGRRIRYRVGALRRTGSHVELVMLSLVLAAVLAAVLGAGVAGLVALVHHASHGSGNSG
jgi:hypothetical protein